MNLPSLSVIVPCWNAERWVARAIQSALDQAYPQLSVIVIDDGSEDGSVDVLRSFTDRISWETGPNRGACAARNRGLALAQSDYVVFLDADDYMTPASLVSWGRTAAETGADIVFGPFAYEIDGARRRGVPPPTPATPRIVLQHWLEGWFTPPCAVLWRSAFLNSIGGWNSAARYIRTDDGELAVRAFLHDPSIAVADRGLGVYVQHDSANRISKRAGAGVVIQEFELFDRLWNTHAQKYHQDKQVRRSFGYLFYRYAYEAFSVQDLSLGYRALERARELGILGHPGSVTHRLFAHLFGLRRKMWLSGALKGRKPSFVTAELGSIAQTAARKPVTGSPV
jgi:glycosyltransferase involved in cell wall biosynthesis